MQQFEWSVRALAQEAAVQRALFPHFVEVADELALDFDEHLRALRAAGTVELTAAQLHAIDLLDFALDAMSGAAHEALWELAALDEAPAWARIRQLAREVIRVMAWSDEPPPTDRAIYVKG